MGPNDPTLPVIAAAPSGPVVATVALETGEGAGWSRAGTLSEGSSMRALDAGEVLAERYEIVKLLGLSQVEDANDVLVRDLAGEDQLLLETLEHRGIARQLGAVEDARRRAAGLH